MATISFKIRHGSKKEASIYLIFSFGRRKELRYSTGWKIKESKNWDAAKQRVKNVIAEDKVDRAGKVNHLRRMKVSIVK